MSLLPWVLMVYGYSLTLWTDNASAGSPFFDLQFSLAITTTVLVSYHPYPHDLTVLVITYNLTFNYALAKQLQLSIAAKAFQFALISLYLPFPIVLEHTGSFGSLVAPILILYGYPAFKIDCFNP